MPTCIRSMVESYFNNLQMCFSAQDFTTGWQRLEVGIAMGCAILPTLFVAAFEIILIGARQMAGGIKLMSGGAKHAHQKQRCWQPENIIAGGEKCRTLTS